MNWVKFCQYLLDNKHLKMPKDVRGYARSPKKVVSVSKRISFSGKGKDYISIMFEDSNTDHLIEYPFTGKLSELENIFRRNDKLNKI